MGGRLSSERLGSVFSSGKRRRPAVEEEEDVALSKVRRCRRSEQLLVDFPVLELVLMFFDAAAYCQMEETCVRARRFLLESPASRRMWLSLARGFPSFKTQLKFASPRVPLKQLFRANALMRLPLESALARDDERKFSDFVFTVEVSSRSRARVYAANLNPRRVFRDGGVAGSLRTRRVSPASANRRGAAVRILCLKKDTGQQALLYEASGLDARALHPTTTFFAPQAHRLRGKDVIVRLYFSATDELGLDDPTYALRGNHNTTTNTDLLWPHNNNNSNTQNNNLLAGDNNNDDDDNNQEEGPPRQIQPQNDTDQPDGARRYYISFHLRTDPEGPSRRLHRKEILAFLNRWLHFV